MRILLFILFICPSLVFAQSEPKYHFSTDLGFTYSIIESSERVETQLGLSVLKGQHQVRVAAVIQTYSSEAVNNPKIWQITGGAFSYYYHIPTQSKYFDLTFRYEGTLQFYENEWVGTFYDDISKDYIAYKYESKELFSANTLGYGFKVNITDKLYFATKIAAGVYFSTIKGEREGTSYPTNVRLDFRGYENFGFTWKTALNLGYTF